MDTIKDKLNFNKMGKKIKKVKDGITISKVELDKLIIFCVTNLIYICLSKALVRIHLKDGF